MLTWHYILIKHVYPKGEIHFAVHEYYPATETWTDSPVTLWGTDFDDINHMISCVAQDIGYFNIIEVKHDDCKVAQNVGPLLKRIKELEAKLEELEEQLEDKM